MRKGGGREGGERRAWEMGEKSKKRKTSDRDEEVSHPGG